MLAIAATGVALAAWMVAADAPIAVVALFVAGAIVVALVAAQGVRPTESGLHLRYVLRRRILRWDDIVDVRFADFRSFGERRQRPAVITISTGAVRLPGVEPSAPFLRRPTFPALDRVERAWRQAIADDRKRTHGGETRQI